MNGVLSALHLNCDEIFIDSVVWWAMALMLWPILSSQEAQRSYLSSGCERKSQSALGPKLWCVFLGLLLIFSPHNFTDLKHWNGVICCFLLCGMTMTKYLKTMSIYAFGKRFYLKRIVLHSIILCIWEWAIPRIEPMTLTLIVPYSVHWATGIWE